MSDRSSRVRCVRRLQDSAAVVVAISFDRAEKAEAARSRHDYRSFIDHYLERLWREPRSTGRTALNVVRFAENEPEGE
jgi:hypothetical protein